MIVGYYLLKIDNDHNKESDQELDNEDLIPKTLRFSDDWCFYYQHRYTKGDQNNNSKETAQCLTD